MTKEERVKTMFRKIAAVLAVATLIGLAPPAFAATHTKVPQVSATADLVTWTWTSASLAAANADSCTALINIGEYLDIGAVSTGAGLVNLTLAVYNWGTNVDSTRTQVQVGPGADDFKTIYTFANTGSNLQEPTLTGEVATKALTIPIADIDRVIKIISTNADASTAGTMTYRLKMIRVD